MATTVCQHCETNTVLCRECFDFTHRRASTKSHTSIPIEHHVAPSKRRLPTQCAAHANQVVELFCRDCEMLICTKCGSYSHKTHTFAPIADEAATLVEAMLAAALPVVQGFVGITQARDRCQHLLGELREHTAAVDVEVDDLFRNIQRAVVARRAVVKEALEEAAARKQGLLQACAEQLDDQRNHTEAGLALVKRTLDNASAVELLGVCQTLAAGLAGLERHGLELAPPCTSRIALKKTAAYDALLTAVGKVGAITDDA
jgi:hypothetical protein